MATLPKDTLNTVQQTGFSASWDWKNEYVSNFQNDGYERFAQYSASPDTTILYAGPARFPAVSVTSLIPIGLTDGLSFGDNSQLTRLFEIGSNRSFFTRGKDQPTVRFQKLLADQANLLYALTQVSLNYNQTQAMLNSRGETAPGPVGPNPTIAMNLNSEVYGIPFGMLIIFKTRGNTNTGNANTPTGMILTGIYLEYCMISSYDWNVQAGQPVIAEGVAIEFDRVVPVSFAGSAQPPLFQA